MPKDVSNVSAGLSKRTQPKCANLSRTDVNGATAAGLSESVLTHQTHTHTHAQQQQYYVMCCCCTPPQSWHWLCLKFYEQRRVLQVQVGRFTLHFSCRADANRSGCCREKERKNLILHTLYMRNVRNTSVTVIIKLLCNYAIRMICCLAALKQLKLKMKLKLK